MPSFNQRSLDNLSTCHNDWQVIMSMVVMRYDCSVICGHRNEEEQHTAWLNNKSKKDWPDSKHNTLPSMAIDVTPYPLNYADLGSFYMLSGWIMCIADRLLADGVISHKVRYGGDWDGDRSTADQSFHDLGHLELIPVT